MNNTYINICEKHKVSGKKLMRKFSKSKSGYLHFFRKFTGDVVINYFQINYFEL